MCVAAVSYRSAVVGWPHPRHSGAGRTIAPAAVERPHSPGAGLDCRLAARPIYIWASSYACPPMKWTHYLACFFAGFWALNVVPHLLHGISGTPFPTPFASPPFQGLSSPLVNTVWALSNIVLVYWLARVGRLSPQQPRTLGLFFLGFAVLACFMAYAAPQMLKQ